MYKMQMFLTLLVVLTISGCAEYTEFSREYDAEQKTKSSVEGIRTTFLRNVKVRIVSESQDKATYKCQNYVGHPISCSSAGALRKGLDTFATLSVKSQVTIKNNSKFSITCWGGDLRNKKVKVAALSTQSQTFKFKGSNHNHGHNGLICSRSDSPKNLAVYRKYSNGRANFIGIYDQSCKRMAYGYAAAPNGSGCKVVMGL